MANYTQQCRFCFQDLEGDGPDYHLVCVAKDYERLERWWKATYSNLFRYSTRFKKWAEPVLSDPEYGGGWQDNLVPYILHLEANIRHMNKTDETDSGL